MIKAIAFDLDGVYFSTGKKEFMATVAKKFGINEQTVSQLFLDSPQMAAYKKGEISGENFWEYAIKEWKIRTTCKELLQILQQSYTENKQLLRLIIKLRNSGYQIICCSNNFVDMISMLNDKFDFLKNFDYTLFSYDWGILKPKLFEKITEITSFKPDEIILIDDNEELIKDVVKLGFHAILYGDAHNIEKELHVAGIDMN